MIFHNGNRVDEFQHDRPDGSAAAVAAIDKAHAGGGLAQRLRAAANAVLADSTPTTGDPALAQERNAGIATIKSAHLAPERGAIGESLVQKISREITATLTTAKKDD